MPQPAVNTLAREDQRGRLANLGIHAEVYAEYWAGWKAEYRRAGLVGTGLGLAFICASLAPVPDWAYLGLAAAVVLYFVYALAYWPNSGGSQIADNIRVAKVAWDGIARHVTNTALTVEEAERAVVEAERLLWDVRPKSPGAYPIFSGMTRRGIDRRIRAAETRVGKRLGVALHAA